MPLTGAERARLYRKRKKQNEEEYAEYLQNERKRYQERKNSGKIKLVNNMTDREKRQARKKWRQSKRQLRKKSSSQPTELDTPPPTPPTGPFPINLRKAGRRRIRKDRSKAYRDIKKLEEKVANQQRMIEKYKKRLQRSKAKAINADSPRAQTKTILRGQRVNSDVRRTLLFHHVFLKGLRAKYNNTKSEKRKQLFANVMTSELLKKYRMKQMARKSLDLSQRRVVNESADMKFARKKRKTSIVDKLHTHVKDFLCRDDNSRVKAGKKSTKTKCKDKKQIRLLNDTMKNLHLKYLAENSDKKLSYSLFCQLRPFFVRQPNVGDRETCLCKRHENLQFKADKLKQLKLIESKELDHLTRQIACGVDKKECMYRECSSCINQDVKVQSFDVGIMVEWQEWRTKKMEKKADDGTKVYTMTVKDEMKGTIETLVEEFQLELKKTAKHLYNIQHQHMAIRTLKEKLTEDDILIHVDFSENYSCKYSTEIQSLHFGASQRQISLHTGVMYSKGMTVPFCSMSDNLKHGPGAVWAHLKPVFYEAREEKRCNLFVLSDGPTTQYRNKENFYLLSNLPYKMGFKSVNWNFSEAGHGKGAPDGIGAVVKREADRAVHHGQDINNASALFNVLNSTKTTLKLFLIEDKDIATSEEELSHTTLRAIQGTMKIHQLFSTTPGEVWYRDVSCFCVHPRQCECYSPICVQLPCSDNRDRDEVHSDDHPIDALADSLKGRYCVVSYDGKPYPGIITDVDEGEVEVSVMHAIGSNRFFWPMMTDVLWYNKEHFVMLIEAPEKVTNRHFQIPKQHWKSILKMFDT